jgi:hypothetical protein
MVQTLEVDMLSSKADLKDFVDKIADEPYDDIILITNKEATAAERYCYRQQNEPVLATEATKMKKYADLLKDLLVYVRHGVATSSLRKVNCQSLTKLPKD